MTALPKAMATRNGFLTTAKALERALRQAESDQPATDPAPFYWGKSPLQSSESPDRPVKWRRGRPSPPAHMPQFR